MMSASTLHFIASSLSRSFRSCSYCPNSSYFSLQSHFFVKSPSASSSLNMEEVQSQPKFMDFPYLSPAHKDLMLDIVSTVESRLQSDLLLCTLPPDVQYYRNESGTSHASLHIRSGRESSSIDFIMGSWLHSDVPSGGTLDITSFLAYLNTSTDAPHLLVELIRTTPNSLILILDLPPRMDLVLNPEYLKSFYESTNLDAKRRFLLESSPKVRPYQMSSLFLRCTLSPTAILVHIDMEEADAVEEMVRGSVGRVVKEVVKIWLDDCACGGREMGDERRSAVAERDFVLKSNAIEVDLGSSLPSLFGPQVAGRVIRAIQQVFRV